MYSASMSAHRLLRAKTPRGIVRPSLFTSSSRTSSYGPATSAVMYDEMRGVGSKPHVDEPPSSWGIGSGVGWFDTTFHSDGAVTVNWKVALRSGCSNTAKTRRES